MNNFFNFLFPTMRFLPSLSILLIGELETLWKLFNWGWRGRGINHNVYPILQPTVKQSVPSKDYNAMCLPPKIQLETYVIAFEC